MNGKSTRYILYLLLAAILGWWIRAGWLLLYPFRPLVVHSITIMDEDNVVTAGTPLNYAVDYEKFMDIPAKVRLTLVNSYSLTLSGKTGLNKI